MGDTIQDQPLHKNPEHKTIHVQEQKQETLREHLTSLQSWQGAESTFAEQRQQMRQRLSQQQVEENATLQAGMQQQVAPITATQTAHGTPVQVQAPARQTWKEKREQTRRAKEADKQVKGADHVSYVLCENLHNHLSKQNNSMDAYGLSELKNSGVDDRALQMMCKGFKTDRKGNPATPEDAANKAADLKMLADYTSKNVERRKPYLTKLVAELQDYHFSTDMFTEEKLQENMTKYKDMGDKIVYFEGIVQDPINKPFFDAMPQAELEVLKSRMKTMGGAFATQLANKVAMKGVVLDDGIYVQRRSNMTVAQQSDEMFSAMFSNSIQQHQQIEDSQLERYVAEQKTNEMAMADNLHTQITQGEEFADLHDIHFTTFATGQRYDHVAKYRTMIESHPEAYADHQPLVDRMYQDYYRGVDAMGDMNLEAKSLQAVVDNLQQKAQTSAYYAKMVRTAVAKQEELQAKIKIHTGQLQQISESMDFYLGDVSMSAQAKHYLDRIGVGVAAQELHNLREVKKAFLGENGAVQQSNESFHQVKKGGGSPIAARASALTALGIRNSSAIPAKVDKAMRGDTFAPLPVQIADYMQAKKESGADMGAILSQSVRQDNYSFGEGMNEITRDLFTMAKDLFATEKSVAYLTTMHNLIGKADVFADGANESIQYLMHGLMNSFAANYSLLEVRNDVLNDERRTISLAREACRTLLSLAPLMRETQEKKATLPPHIQELLADYEAMIDTLTQRVTSAPTSPEI